MPTHSKKWYGVPQNATWPRIYCVPTTNTKQRLRDGCPFEEVPGYDVMKAKLWLLDARLVTSGKCEVWYIWDDKEGDFIEEGNMNDHRPRPFNHIEDAFEYIKSERRLEQRSRKLIDALTRQF